MIITEQVVSSIRSHASETYPEECCGLILGDRKADTFRATDIYRSENTHSANRRRRYLIAPDTYRYAENEAGNQGLDVIGMYHSHPDHPAVPSETDLELATFPGFVYAIVSVQDGVPDRLTAWTLAPDRSTFEEEPISIQQPA